MGQESSQVTEDTQNHEGDMNQAGSGSKGAYRPDEERLKGNAEGQDPSIDGGTRAVKVPKARKKQKRSSLSQKVQEATEAGASRGSLGDSQRLESMEGTDIISPVRSLKQKNRKKAKLEKKKQPLPTAATEAFRDPHRQYLDGDTAELASDEEMEAGGTTKSKFERNAAADVTKTLNKSRQSRGATKAAGAGKLKKSESMSKHKATNGDIENSSIQHSKLDGTLKAANIGDASKPAVNKKRKSNNLEGDSPKRPRKRPNQMGETSNANSAKTQPDNKSSHSDDFSDNSNGPGHRMSHSPTLGIDPVATPDQSRRALILEEPTHESDADVPHLPPKAGGTKAMTSNLEPLEATAQTRNGISGGGKPPRKLRSTLVAGIMTPDKSQAAAVEKDLIEPALHNSSIGHMSEDDQRQLGMNDTAFTESSGRRKRRLPVDDDTLDPDVTKSMKKKSRKRGLKPKTPRVPTTVGSPRTNVDEPVTRSVNSSSQKDSTKIVGRFNAAEIAILDKEMLKHREMFNMSEYDQNQLIHKDASRASDFWKEVCEALPDRPRQAIIKMCRRKYHNYGTRGKWTVEEAEELKEAYERFPKRWKEIGEYLHRHPEDVRDRWRNYGVCGENQKKDFWTEDEEDNLRVAVAECLQAVKELKAAQAAKNRSLEYDTPDIELVDWLVVSEKLGHTRSRLQCSTKWKQITKVENSDNDGTPDLRIRNSSWRVRASKTAVNNMRRDDQLELLLAIRNSQAGREGKVPWRKIGDMDLRTKWSCMDRKVAWKKLRASVPGNEDMKLQDIVTQLIEHLLTKKPVDTQFVVKPPSKTPSQPALRAATQPSHTNRRIQGDDRPGQDKPGKRIAGEDEDYQYLGQGEEDEFDPDDFERQHADAHKNFKSSQDVVRGVIDEEYEYENSESEDHDGPSQQELSPSRAAKRRLLPPFGFEELGVETPTRRSGTSLGSVDLDESS